MTIFGIGPKVVLSGASTFALGVMAGWHNRFFAWPLPAASRWWGGGVLAAVGGWLLIEGAWRIVRGYRAGRLVREGVYGLVRNPMYSAYIVFLTPVLSLWLDNFLLLAASGAMLVAFRTLVRHEERWLEECFGDAYRTYRMQVKQIIPFLW